jgi:hypothetical protein
MKFDCPDHSNQINQLIVHSSINSPPECVQNVLNDNLYNTQVKDVDSVVPFVERLTSSNFEFANERSLLIAC